MTNENRQNVLPWVQGNKLELAIPMQIVYFTDEGKTTEDYIPQEDSTISVVLCGKVHSRTYTPTIVDNVLHIVDNGSLCSDFYSVVILVEEPDGTKRRSKWNYMIKVYDSNEEVVDYFDDFPDWGSGAIIENSVFYFVGTVQTEYVNISSIAELPIEGETHNIYRVANYNGTQVVDDKYCEYAWDGEKYVLLAVFTSLVGDGVFDVSVHNGKAYSTLASALEDVPINMRTSGMSIKYLNSSNKYVQWRYMLGYTNSTQGNNDFITTDNWQGIDNVPTKNSNNLVESGGVFEDCVEAENVVGDPLGDWVESEAEAYVDEKIADVQEQIDNLSTSSYQKPNSGIPSSDMAQQVQQSLTNADKTFEATGDKEYAQSAFSGMGRVNLQKNIQLVSGVQKNILTQDMFYKTVDGQRVPNTNTIFVIQYDYDLNDSEGENPITIPEGCVLKFDGGSLKNGTLVGNDTSVEGNYLFNNMSFSQSFIFEIIDSSKFIGYESDTYLLRTLINLWLNNDVETLYLENRTYNITWDKTFVSSATLFTEVEGAKCKTLDGNGAILNDTYDGYVTNSEKNGCFIRFYKCSDISILNLNYVGLERDLSSLNTNDYSSGIDLFQFLETTNIKILGTIKNQRCFASLGTFYRKMWPELNGCQNVDINIKAKNVGYGFISNTCNTLKAFVETNVQHRAFYCGGVTNADINIVVKSLSTRNIPLFLVTDGQRYLGEEYESETSDGFARIGCSNIRAKIDFTPNTPKNFTSDILKETNLFYIQFYDYDIVQYERTQPLCFENIEVAVLIHNGNSNSFVYPRFLEADSLTKYLLGDAIKNVKYSLFYDDNFGVKNLQTVVATNLLSVRDVEIKVNKISNILGGSNQKDAFVLKGGTITTLDMQGYYTVDAESIGTVSSLTAQDYQYLDKNNNTINPYLHLINTEVSEIGTSFTNANGKVENIYSSYRMDRLDNVKIVEPFSFKPVVTANGLSTIGFMLVAKYSDTVVQVLLTPYSLGSKTESPYYGTSFAFPGGSWQPSDVKILTRSYDGTSWTKWFVLARSANASTTERRMNNSQAAKGTIMYNISNAINKLTMFNGSSWTELDGAGVGVARSGDTRPSGSDIYIGFHFFDTTLGKPIYWNGTAWVDASGTAVS